MHDDTPPKLSKSADLSEIIKNIIAYFFFEKLLVPVVADAALSAGYYGVGDAKAEVRTLHVTI